MLGYYLVLAARSLTRNVALTALMIAAVGVGVGASMAVLTIYRGMAADPIPEKSRQLFAPQIDSWGPVRTTPSDMMDGLNDQLSYTDVESFLKVSVPHRQAAMYGVGLIVMPPDAARHPFEVPGRATSADFFAMFQVPLRYGSPWTRADDEHRAHVVVLSNRLNERLFDGRNSVGRTLRLNSIDYSVVGVLDDWWPLPRFYDTANSYGPPEDAFIPFNLAIDQKLGTTGSWNCNSGNSGPGWEIWLHSDCVWLKYWVELPTDADVRAYRWWLANYAAEQQRGGRFHWSPRTQLRDVRQWLDYHHIVSNEVSMLVLVSFSFLLVCLLNAMGLMLAKIVGGARDIAVRRALGARRLAVLAQCIVETGVVGFLGGLVGLGLTALSLFGLRQLLSQQGQALLHLDAMDVALTVLLAVVATILAGLYPTWRAMSTPPAPQLKAL
jgi:putative ABC transport system permease protein